MLLGTRFVGSGSAELKQPKLMTLGLNHMRLEDICCGIKRRLSLGEKRWTNCDKNDD